MGAPRSEPKTITDARRIRSWVIQTFEQAEQETDPDRRQALLTFVLVGGGPTGVEMAGALAELTHYSIAHEYRHIDPRTARIRLFEMEQRRFLESEGKVWEGEDYVFTNEHGRPISPSNLLRGFKRALKRADLPQETTIHHLRHSVGSILMADGQNIDAVTELLGHSSRSVTEKIYAHALPEKKREAGASLGYLLRGEEA